MSKSTGNYIGIDEPPGVIFTKVLNVPDKAMRSYAELVRADHSPKLTSSFKISKRVSSACELKHELAWEIVSIFHGDEAADRAVQDAADMHQGQAPSDAPVFNLTGPANIIDLLYRAEVVKSKSDARRLIQQGGVRLDGVQIEDIDLVVEPQPGKEQVLQAGKRRFVRLAS